MKNGESIKIEKKKNLSVGIMKFIAMFCVIGAHCNSVSVENIFAQKSSLLLQNIGSISVIIFFVLAGAFFHYDKYSIKVFLKNKVALLLLPWIISGTAVYLYVYLRKYQVDFLSWFYYVIGNGSYLYYLTILLIFYVVFYFIKPLRNTWVLLGLMAVTIVSVIFFSDKGYVTSMSDRDLIKGALNTETNKIKKCYIPVPDSLLDINIDIIDALKTWSTMPVKGHYEKTDVTIKSSEGSVQLVKSGKAALYSEEEATKVLGAKEVTAIIELHDGNFDATAWGCDLTFDYVTINADYRS